MFNFTLDQEEDGVKYEVENFFLSLLYSLNHSWILATSKCKKNNTFGPSTLTRTECWKQNFQSCVTFNLILPKPWAKQLPATVAARFFSCFLDTFDLSSIKEDQEEWEWKEFGREEKDRVSKRYHFEKDNNTLFSSIVTSHHIKDHYRMSKLAKTVNWGIAFP